MIQYKKLTFKDISKGFLNTFNRYQVNHKIYFVEDNELKIKPFYYEENWDEEEKLEKTNRLINTLKQGGVVIGVYDGDHIIGFSSVDAKLFNGVYLNLDLIHIKNEYRKKGFGSILLEKTKEEAKKLGAKKLYISANPAYETIQFYIKNGCILAKTINEELQRLEPYDIPLELHI